MIIKIFLIKIIYDNLEKKCIVCDSNYTSEIDENGKKYKKIFEKTY